MSDTDMVEAVARAIAPYFSASDRILDEHKDAARAAMSVLEPRIEQLERELAETKAELERRDRNETRNCINWGPCSAHDGRMADVPPIGERG